MADKTNQAQTQLNKLTTRCNKGPNHYGISMHQFVLGGREFDFESNFKSSMKELRLAERSADAWINDWNTVDTWVHIVLHPEKYQDGLENVLSSAMGNIHPRSNFRYTKFKQKKGMLLSPTNQKRAHIRYARVLANPFYLSAVGVQGQQYLAFNEYLQVQVIQGIELSVEDTKKRMAMDAILVKSIFEKYTQCLKIYRSPRTEFDTDSHYATGIIAECFQELKSRHTRTLNVHQFSSWFDYYDQLSIHGKELFCSQVSLYILKKL